MTWWIELLITGNEMIMVWHDMRKLIGDNRKQNNNNNMVWHEEINWW